MGELLAVLAWTGFFLLTDLWDWVLGFCLEEDLEGDLAVTSDKVLVFLGDWRVLRALEEGKYSSRGWDISVLRVWKVGFRQRGKRLSFDREAAFFEGFSLEKLTTYFDRISVLFLRGSPLIVSKYSSDAL